MIDKQPQLQWLPIGGATEHAARGASVWDWAGTEKDGGRSSQHTDGDPDVVLACAGDTPTLETVAAAWWLRRLAPGLSVRVVNVIDLMTLFSPHDHPHGMADDAFNRLFTTGKPVIFAFHGYQDLVHQMLHHRSHPGRFHVRGFIEEGAEPGNGFAGEAVLN